MKKILIFIITLISCFVMASCEKKEGTILPIYNPEKISTIDNKTIFPTKRSDVHYEEIKASFDAYNKEKNLGIEVYEVYSLLDIENANSYNIDIFEMFSDKCINYFLKHNNDLYSIVPFPLTGDNYNCLTHIAITDANKDGYIEVFTSVSSFKQRTNYYYSASFISVIDTKTKNKVSLYDADTVTYFKENEDGIISIYKTSSTVPKQEDLVDGKLSEKYYYKADTLYETPTLNNAIYEFKETKISRKCLTYEVDIEISDGTINFPYLFKKAISPVYFNVDVEMKYLGPTFGYTSPDTYLDGATITFKNNKSTISCEPWGAGCAITHFVIYTGMTIESNYRFCENGDKNIIGTYDMIINYQLETIVVKDFLTVYR